MKNRPVVIILGITLAVIGILAYLGVNWVAPYAIITPMRVEAEQHGRSYDHPRHPSAYQLTYDSLNILVDDTINLAGYFVKPQEEDSMLGAVIFLHGVSSCKEEFVNFSNNLSKRNIASVLFDLRAHGQSGGTFNTFGYHEKRDVAAVAKHIREVYGEMPVGVWGNSLGGAIAYQSLAHDPSLDFGVIQSTFAHLPQIVDDYGKRWIKVRIPGLADFALKKASKIAQFPGEKVSPAESCKQISQPVYAMHGDADVNISISYGKENFDNIPHANKVWFVVKGADHYNLPAIASEHINGTVIPWVIQQMKQP